MFFPAHRIPPQCAPAHSRPATCRACSVRPGPHPWALPCWWSRGATHRRRETGNPFHRRAPGVSCGASSPFVSHDGSRGLVRRPRATITGSTRASPTGQATYSSSSPDSCSSSVACSSAAGGVVSSMSRVGSVKGPLWPQPVSSPAASNATKPCRQPLGAVYRSHTFLPLSATVSLTNLLANRGITSPRPGHPPP